MPSLSFRSPGKTLSLDALLARAIPQSEPDLLGDLVDRGFVCVSGQQARKLRSRVPGGRLVEVRDVESAPAPRASRSCLVLVPALPWRSGVLAKRRGCATGVVFEARNEREPVMELLVTLPSDARDSDGGRFVADVLVTLAGAGTPVLGDVENGGVLVDGGLRLVPEGADPPDDWWPEEPVFVGWDPGSELPRLSVSAATSRIVRRGHPWVLRDEGTGDPEGFAPGTRVEVVDPSGPVLGSACIEGSGKLTARLWALRATAGASVEARVAKALKRRRSLLESRDTDAYRLIHGEADGLPGLFVDRLGTVLRVLVTSAGTASYRTRTLDALSRAVEATLGADPPVIEVIHLRDRPPGALVCTRLVRGQGQADGKLVVRERGVGFLVDLGLGRPDRSSPGVGLFLDQRENRGRLIAGSGGRLLNLFAHTGAFSVAWLAAGLGRAVSVDLSAGYLRWLEENLSLNEIDRGLHESVKHDGRRYLETLSPDDFFDAIVLDPPTAAAAGRRFWSVGRDLPPLVEQALAHLAPGGRLLVSRNDRRGSGLVELVRRSAEKNGVSLASVQAATPGVDFPTLSGFPEGDSFSAVVATLG